MEGIEGGVWLYMEDRGCGYMKGRGRCDYAWREREGCGYGREGGVWLWRRGGVWLWRGGVWLWKGGVWLWREERGVAVEGREGCGLPCRMGNRSCGLDPVSDTP